MLTTIEWDKIKALVDQAVSKAVERPELQKSLSEISEKIKLIQTFSLKVSVNLGDIELMHSTINRLKTLVGDYTRLKGTTDLDALNNIKVGITGELMYLATLRDEFLLEIEYLDEMYKKEILPQVIQDIADTEKISFTQAEKKAPGDSRMNRLRADVYTLKKAIAPIKTSYDFYSRALQMVMQSISTLTKESRNSRME